MPARAAAGVGLAGAVLAVVATFSTVIEIKVLTVPTFAQQGWDRYGPALLLLAVFAVLMVAGAWRGARPAMAGLAITGAAVLAIAIVVDVPHLDDTGVWPGADLYEDAQAAAGIGFYFETAAGVLMLLGGVFMLMLAPRGAAGERARPARREPGAAPARAAAPDPAPAAATPRATPVEPDPAEAPREPSEPGTAAPEAGSDDWFAPRAQRLTQPAPPRKRQGGLLGRLRKP